MNDNDNDNWDDINDEAAMAAIHEAHGLRGSPVSFLFACGEGNGGVVLVQCSVHAYDSGVGFDGSSVEDVTFDGSSTDTRIGWVLEHPSMSASFFEAAEAAYLRLP